MERREKERENLEKDEEIGILTQSFKIERMY